MSWWINYNYLHGEVQVCGWVFCFKNKTCKQPFPFTSGSFLILLDDLADNLEDVDFEDAGNADDDEGWETEDEMEAEAEQDDSELTFSKHTGKTSRQLWAVTCRQPQYDRCELILPSSDQIQCFVWVWILQQTLWLWREERMIRPMFGGWAMERFCWSAQVSVSGRQLHLTI